MLYLKAELVRLKSLFDSGFITNAEYMDGKEALLASSRVVGDPPPPLPPPPGMTIGPDSERLFRLETKLGGGAMGEVWKGEDLAKSKIVGQTVWVAIKVLFPLLSAGKRHTEVSRRLAIMAGRLYHPSIRRIHDWHIDMTGGFPFLVMEYLEGQDLT